MATQSDRLASLIEFTKQTALLKKTPFQQFSQHKDFYRAEERIKGLPGVAFNCTEADEIWLRVDRLHETRPPAPESKLLEAWIDLSGAPNKEPTLKSLVARKALVEIGALIETSDAPPTTGISGGREIDPLLVRLEGYPEAEALKTQLKAYLEAAWSPWSAREKEIRKSIALYSELFMLSQKMQGNLGDSQLELVWGTGIAVWNSPAGSVSYPLLTQLVEISLNETTMALEIRPRSSETRLEIDLFVAMDNQGVAPLVETYKTFFKAMGDVLNPFEQSTFEPVLQSAAMLLEASGTYWPSKTTADDRTIPKASEHLIVTDTWVLMARPRTNNLFIQDLERFEALLADQNFAPLPRAILSLVTEPSSSNEEPLLPAFRGLSTVSGSGAARHTTTDNVAELYFPMAYNEEQVQIVQMLEAYDGVVVQGPPGTGKTHTIANVICHYLACGKRVLVTSMKDPALAVLQEKLPEPIRPLAISLLTSEAEGMKQFEFSINKIASEVTRIDRSVYKAEIEQLDGRINALHGRMARTDKEIANWARLNLNSLHMDNEVLAPLEIAELVVANRHDAAWLTDTLTPDPANKAQFDNADIQALREARSLVGPDLIYLSSRLPSIVSFPETSKLLQLHQDLSQLDELRKLESDGIVPNLVGYSFEIIKETASAASKASNLRLLVQDIEGAQQPWTHDLKNYLRRTSRNEILDLFSSLRDEILTAMETRKQFLAKPVTIADGAESDAELVEAICNLSQGKKPFGLAGIFGKTEKRRLLDNTLVIADKPNSIGEWSHVLEYLKFRQLCKALAVRWNTLCGEISLPVIEAKIDSLITMGRAIDLYTKVRRSLMDEADVVSTVARLLPTWPKGRSTPLSKEVLQEIEGILNHHLIRHRLSETWTIKDAFLNALNDCDGSITERLKDFINTRIGNKELSVAAIQNEWVNLIDELRRIHTLAPSLKEIVRVTGLIAYSGAAIWANQLRKDACSSTQDPLLPDNWREVWRLRRLTTFIDKIDSRGEIKRLSTLRAELEQDLSKLYQEAITKRTWLKLAENATHSVRAALEAYRAAIKKIGKGTGVRAGRYRQDARFAAERANGAIPCWIMPHYRICETLPASFGCFDLVIIDEASQSDLTALPAILRAQKILIVGDDKQVSPEGVGLEEGKIRNLMSRFLSNQVDIYRAQMTPERSMYDLFKVVFAKSAVMLREHFRCAAPIIEYSKREFYNHELKPLRIPKASERLDPPLIDVLITDGYRNKNINLPEARFIVDEIKALVGDASFKGRTIGVVSLLGDEQALKVMQMLNEELGEQAITQYKITCGDARTFQGKERDIMFLSMVVSSGQAHALAQTMFAQRFNVAASRARDRMYLVRSIEVDEVSQADKLRMNLLQHFQAPFNQNEEQIKNLRDRCESPFEREVFDLLTSRGYRVEPQVAVGAYRIDLVVEGDADTRLAIECDGDKYHGPDRWDSDMRRQRTLERAGWRFWRCFASTFVLHKAEMIQDLVDTLSAHGIAPNCGKGPASSIHVQSRKVVAFPEDESAAAATDDAEITETVRHEHLVDL